MNINEFQIEHSDEIDGVIIFRPTINIDARGSLYTTFYKDVQEQFLPKGLYFKHDKFSTSKHNVLRGIHGDTKSWKLVSCVYGEITEVVVDLRPNSPTYGKWQKFIINKDNQMSVLLPPYMGNAFYVNSEEAVYHYKLAYLGEYFDANEQFSVKWNDPEIAIQWPTDSPTLSNRDK